MMEDILLIQTIERYLKGKMLPEEKTIFEQQRKNIPEIDQMFVEHIMFLNQLEDFAGNQRLKQSLHNVHNQLAKDGIINEGAATTTKAKVIQLWNRYRKVTAIAAVVAGAMALLTSGLVAFFAPVNKLAIQELGQEVEKLKQGQRYQVNKIHEVESKIPKDAEVRGGGSGFLIDNKGYLVTNAHIFKGATFANVYNNGKEYKTKILFIDSEKDLAILKIEDKDFAPLKSLPYGISKQGIDLGEEVFTLGYPKNEIVYNMGYLSAKTGYAGDTLTCQIQMSANPGNSGGPLLNKKGEIIGVISTRQRQAEGVTFAITAKYIYGLVNDLKKSDVAYQNIKLPTYSSIKGMDRVGQIKKIEDCVFLIKAYN
ncbi:MAG: trypsin-like peptidase domain-containing protein [Chitinophagaceae bacterium]|nr:serine protease [Chitinophagaceae bacterium]MCC6635312.1 trypsin-like peptidase domain-containing protein [Chitinophagaceae bacterium]